MSEEKQKMRIVFAPGVLEQLEAENSPEELQALFDSLQEQFADGSFLENSDPVNIDELRESDPELYEQLLEQIDRVSDIVPPKLH